jgi:hypothetical protein
LTALLCGQLDGLNQLTADTLHSATHVYANLMDLGYAIASMVKAHISRDLPIRLSNQDFPANHTVL